MTRGRLLTVVLAGALLLAALLPWAIPADRLAAVTLPAGPRGEVEAPASVRPLQPLDSYAATVERPLFTATRRAAPASAAVADRGSNLVLGRYRLTGVIVTPRRRSILLAGAGNRTQTVALGEVIDGWTLTTVEREQVVLENGGRREVVAVGKPDSARAPR